MPKICNYFYINKKQKKGIKINNLFLVKNGYSKMPKICNKLYINKKQKKGKIIYIYFWNKNKNTIEIKKRFKDLKIIYYIIYI
jgi:hypothetical protein